MSINAILKAAGPGLIRTGASPGTEPAPPGDATPTEKLSSPPANLSPEAAALRAKVEEIRTRFAAEAVKLDIGSVKARVFSPAYAPTPAVRAAQAPAYSEPQVPVFDKGVFEQARTAARAIDAKQAARAAAYRAALDSTKT